jgi:hypothetical protein
MFHFFITLPQIAEFKFWNFSRALLLKIRC